MRTGSPDYEISRAINVPFPGPIIMPNAAIQVNVVEIYLY